jgi:undecaprenyl-diphosphatase
MLENLVLGLIQGVAEWLPVSSEGIIVLVKTKFFGGAETEVMIREALFLHLGTFFAALVYFRKDVKKLLKFNSFDASTKKLFGFLAIATVISGAVGYVLLQAVIALEDFIVIDAKKLMLAIGVLLLITAYLQFRSKKQLKEEKGIQKKDGVLLGLVQGLAVLPGLSRSGTTVATLLMRGYDDSLALKLSFLMSLPIVLAGNILLNLGDLALSAELMVGLVTAFVFGLLTIKVLIRLAKKINFTYFVLLFALLSFVAAFV